jgi:hypothetical protein
MMMMMMMMIIIIIIIIIIKDLSSIFNICRPSVHYRVSWSAIQSNFHGFTAWIAEISAEGVRDLRYTVSDYTKNW